MCSVTLHKHQANKTTRRMAVRKTDFLDYFGTRRFILFLIPWQTTPGVARFQGSPTVIVACHRMVDH